MRVSHHRAWVALCEVLGDDGSCDGASISPIPRFLPYWSPFLHTHLSPPDRVWDSSKQAAHYHTLGCKLGASSLTRHLAGLGAEVASSLFLDLLIYWTCCCSLYSRYMCLYVRACLCVCGWVGGWMGGWSTRRLILFCISEFKFSRCHDFFHPCANSYPDLQCSILSFPASRTRVLSCCSFESLLKTSH
jgi:hypothetical protein